MTDEYVLDQILSWKLEWQENNVSGGYITKKDGNVLRIKGGQHSFIILTVTFEDCKTLVFHEPRSPIWKRSSQKKELLQAILNQAIKQAVWQHAPEYQQQLRQSLFRKLLGFN